MQDGNPAVSTVMVGGPFDALGAGETPSRQKILVCRPAGSSAAEEQRCAKTILSTLARRAYRRPVNEEDVQTLLKFYEVGRREGSFETGIQAALERLLADPQFLFRVSRPPVGVTSAAYRVSDLELASRLSFFLWSSIPDDELLDLATLGKLTEPTVLERQVRRMLADARSNALVSSFAGQWLQLRNLRNVAPDTATFPAFDENLRHAMQRETELFFESQLREDRSVVDLLRADYTFLNERLARHYGRPDVYGIQFRRMTVDDDRRHGLLGHAKSVDGDVVRDPDVACVARQVGARYSTRLAAAAAATQRVDPAGRRARGRAATGLSPGAVGTAPHESRLRELPRRDRSARFRAGKF